MDVVSLNLPSKVAAGRNRKMAIEALYPAIRRAKRDAWPENWSGYLVLRAEKNGLSLMWQDEGPNEYVRVDEGSTLLFSAWIFGANSAESDKIEISPMSWKRGWETRLF